MTNLRPFQIVLLGVFAFLGVLAVILVSGFRPDDPTDNSTYGDLVVVWGTLEQVAFDETVRAISDIDKTFRVVEYYEVDPDTFENQLVNAIAEGRSPDLVVLSHEQLVTQRSKLLPIPYDSISEREYRDAYVDGADIFARPDGIYALPFAVDPIVMYWNRDLFASNGLANPPVTWEAMINQTVPALTIQDTSRNILQSAIAFGEYRNVRNAKEILSLLTLQSGSRMVEEGERGYVVALNESVTGGGRPPFEAALQFYTDFSNAGGPIYSWNRAQDEDRNAFVASDLATYFGYGSEAQILSQRNPNLNFDVAPTPQGANATVKRTFGQFYGFAIPRAAVNQQGGFAAARTMTSAPNAAFLADQLLMAPVHRSTISNGSDNAFKSIINAEALTARGWLDPSPLSTDAILQQMVEDVSSNRTRITNAVTDALDRITLSF